MHSLTTCLSDAVVELLPLRDSTLLGSREQLQTEEEGYGSNEIVVRGTKPCIVEVLASLAEHKV